MVHVASFTVLVRCIAIHISKHDHSNIDGEYVVSGKGR